MGTKYKDAPSILQAREDLCFVCKRGGDLARHHVFEGTANRRQSAKYGLWVYVCPECHGNIHAIPAKNYFLKRDAQEIAMRTYGWSVDDFRARFGKNYL